MTFHVDESWAESKCSAYKTGMKATSKMSPEKLSYQESESNTPLVVARRRGRSFFRFIFFVNMSFRRIDFSTNFNFNFETTTLFAVLFCKMCIEVFLWGHALWGYKREYQCIYELYECVTDFVY